MDAAEASLSSSPGASSVSSTLLFQFEREGLASEGQDDPAFASKQPTAAGNTGGKAKASRRAPLEDAPEPDFAFSPERYLLWHKRALLQRSRVGPGRSHEMHRLYHFWFNFLPENFNEPMYEAFKRYSEEDASAGQTYGLTCLFHFLYRYLSLEFDTAIYDDFETLALKYQDYLGFMEGMECLCLFLAGPQGTAAPASSSMPSDEPLDTSLPEAPGQASLPDMKDDTFCLEPTPMLTSSSNSAASSSSGKPHHFPGIPEGIKVEVDPRVVEQMQLWELSKLNRLQLWRQQQQGIDAGDNQDAASDAQICGSLTGSSEAGATFGDRGMSASHHHKRPGKGKASTWKGGRRSGHVAPPLYGCSPPMSRSFGASPLGT